MRFYKYLAGVAQLVEQLICNQLVGGSSPLTGSTEPRRVQCRELDVVHGIALRKERYPSGQRGRAVNPLAPPTEVRILPSPPEKKQTAVSN